MHAEDVHGGTSICEARAADGPRLGAHPHEALVSQRRIERHARIESRLEFGLLGFAAGGAPKHGGCFGATVKSPG